MLRSPYPYFGGKRKVASVIWSRFGDVSNYVEPFFGSGAALLGRPWIPEWIGSEPRGDETVNDMCGFVANFWRVMQRDDQALAAEVDWPVNECDLEARHRWLVSQAKGLDEALKSDPEFCDIKIAAWWCWGLCQWIGGGWCAEPDQESVPVQLPSLRARGDGVHRRSLRHSLRGERSQSSRCGTEDARDAGHGSTSAHHRDDQARGGPACASDSEAKSASRRGGREIADHGASGNARRLRRRVRAPMQCVVC